MDSEVRRYATGNQRRVLDLTRDCADFAAPRGDGLLHVFVPHATAGIAMVDTNADNHEREVRFSFLPG